MFMIDADNSLAEAWNELETALRESGAHNYQVEAMKMTFFMGAAQVHMTIDANCRGSRDEFVNAMESIRYDIGIALPNQHKAPKRGHS
jgi:hypothetical protein